MASEAKTNGMPTKRSSRKLETSELEVALGDVYREENGGAVKSGAVAGSSTGSAPAGADSGSLFDNIDRNHDGVISREEFEAAMKSKVSAWSSALDASPVVPDAAQPVAAAGQVQPEITSLPVRCPDVAEPAAVAQDHLMGSCDLSSLPKADDDSDEEIGHKPKPRAPQSTRILDMAFLPDDEEEVAEPGPGDAAASAEGGAKEAPPPPPPPAPPQAPPAMVTQQVADPAKTVPASGEISPFLSDNGGSPQPVKAAIESAAPAPQSAAPAPAAKYQGVLFDGDDAAFAAKLSSKLAGEDEDYEESARCRAPQPTRVLDLSDLPPDSDEEENAEANGAPQTNDLGVTQGSIDASFASKLHEKLAVENRSCEEEGQTQEDRGPRAPEPTKVLAKDLLAGIEVDEKDADVKGHVNIDQIDDKLMMHMNNKLAGGGAGDENVEPEKGGLKAPMNTVSLSKDVLANLADSDDGIQDMDDGIGKVAEDPAERLEAPKRGLKAPKPTMQFDDNFMKGVDFPEEDDEEDQRNKQEPLSGLGSALQSLAATQQDLETPGVDSTQARGAAPLAPPQPQSAAVVSPHLDHNDPLAAQLQASLGALSGAEREGIRGEEDNDAPQAGPQKPVAPKNTRVFGSLPEGDESREENAEESREQSRGFVHELEGTLRALDNLQGFSGTAAGQQARQQLSDSLKKLGASGDKFQDDAGYPGGGGSVEKPLLSGVPEPAPTVPAAPAPHAPPQASKAEPAQKAVEAAKPVPTGIQGPGQISVSPFPSPTDGQCTETPSSLSYSLSSLSKEELRTENDKLCQEIESLRMEIQRRRRELRINQKVIAGTA